MDDGVPLVVPEINAADLKEPPRHHRQSQLHHGDHPHGALPALHQAFGVTRIFASSYQAVSGTGARAIAELKRQVEQVVAGQPVTREVYPHQIAFNVLPHVDVFLPNGYTKEEAQNGKRRPQDHAPSRFPRQRHLRPRARLSRPFRRGQRRI
jgi:aspartate-semialdehyde dehydrogenase